MKLDRQKYELARARACMGQKDLVSSWNPERNIAVDQLPDRLPAVIRLRYESGLTYLLGEVPGFPVIPK